MPWTVSNPPPSYKNFTASERRVAVAVANSMLSHGLSEGEAIAAGAARARGRTDKQTKAELFAAAYKRAGVKGLDQPKDTPNHPTKKGVVVTSKNGRPLTIRFGQQGAPHNYSPEARAAFKKRHAKNIARGKTSAAYWANRQYWRAGGPVRRPRKDAPLESGARNRLPDSAFLYIAPGGEKDETGRTVPRSLRKLPVYGPDGKPSVSHIRNALSRLGQASTDIPPSARAEAKRKAKSMLERLTRG